MDHSIIDVLTERIKTHPEEFFDQLTLVQTFNLPQAIGRGTKWPKMVNYILFGDTSLFTEEEKTRFRDALHSKMRETVDVESMKTVMDPVRTFGNEPVTVSSAPITKGTPIKNIPTKLGAQGYQSVIMGVQTGSTVSSDSYSMSFPTETQVQAPKRSLLQRLFDDPV